MRRVSRNFLVLAHSSEWDVTPRMRRVSRNDCTTVVHDTDARHASHEACEWKCKIVMITYAALSHAFPVVFDRCTNIFDIARLEIYFSSAAMWLP